MRPEVQAESPARAETVAAGWRGVVLIAATYVYFLIFAQFGFLKRLDELGIVGAHLKLVMGAMAMGGIAMSLVAPRVAIVPSATGRLRCGLAGCGLAALLAGLPLGVAGGVAVALLIGLALGLLTVTLVTHLELWVGGSASLFKVGLGTGLGYLLCNVPTLFTASPRGIALAGAAVCLVGFAVAGVPGERRLTGLQLFPERSFFSGSDDRRMAGRGPAFGLVLAWFTALIWLDSAAFYILQNSPALKSGAWGGAAHLWRTGAVHLVAALGSAFLLRRRGLHTVLLLAFACLGGACLALLEVRRAGVAALLYPAGVSMYSVALVAVPSFLLHIESAGERARKAGWLYAVAGWFGSAMGIGMAQDLHRVPVWFVGVAAVLFVMPLMLRRGRMLMVWQTMAVAGSLVVAGAVAHVSERGGEAGETGAQRGRRVYIGEGCISCHSQYVRPRSADGVMWGPVQDVAAVRAQRPPLIGNRRQGPDLSEVGGRRSALWLRMHFVYPREVSYRSIMPAYDGLFRGDSGMTRGDDLLAYLESLKTADMDAHLREMMAAWRPVSEVVDATGGERGRELFREHCATCHFSGGAARERWAGSFRRLPPDLAGGALHWVPRELPARERGLRLARIVKFGLSGTDMPGHEYLPDGDVEALAGFVEQYSRAELAH